MAEWRNGGSRLVSLKFNCSLESCYSFKCLAGKLEGAAFAVVAFRPVRPKADGRLRIRKGLAGLPERRGAVAGATADGEGQRDVRQRRERRLEADHHQDQTS